MTGREGFRLNYRSPFFWVTYSALLVSTGCVLLMFLFLWSESAPILGEQGWALFTGQDWYPGEVYGALPMLYGSFVVTVMALVMVLPIALGGALFTSEFLPPGWRWSVKTIMELLAGVPGIIYGLLGVTVLSVGVRDGLGLIDGNTLFTAALLLAMMILPTIMTLSEDALRAIPGEYRDAAWSLGLTRTETLFSVVLPKALPGIQSAVLLGLGRALGETVAVMLVIGGRDRIPLPLYDFFQPGQSIPSKLGREAAESLGSGLQWSALMALGLILFLCVMGVSVISHRFIKRERA